MQTALRGTPSLLCRRQACHSSASVTSQCFGRAAWGVSRARRHCTAATGGKGGGVLDRPITSPTVDKRSETKKKKPPMYRVMLHNDNTNRREYVVKVLMKIVEGLTVDDAVNVMNELAEKYCEGLRNNGLIASIEPCSPKT